MISAEHIAATASRLVSLLRVSARPSMRGPIEGDDQKYPASALLSSSMLINIFAFFLD